MVFKELMLQSQEASVTNVLTPTQLRKSKAYIKKALPSSDALSNIISLHSNAFLQEIRLYPYVHISLCSPQALNVLVDYGCTVFVDGTFDMVEADLIIVTTLMVDVNGLGIPVACMATF
jgi:hypothetical protein